LRPRSLRFVGLIYLLVALGLVIVREAARAFGTQVLLEDRPEGQRGLRVRVPLQVVRFK